jgi:hypothetical protein
MGPNTYKTRVRRKRGRWHVSVPSLPSDAPVIVTDHLANAEVLMIEQLSHYLGCSMTGLSVEVRHPVRPARRTLSQRLTAATVQAWGGVVALSGVYLAAGLAATLIVSGVVLAALGVLRESGRI